MKHNQYHVSIADGLTLLRFFLVGPFVYCMNMNSVSYYILAMSILLVAVLTDILDGYIARKKGAVTAFGKFLDPAVDKILMIVVLVCLYEKGILEHYIIIPMVVRDLAVDSFRNYSAGNGVTLENNAFGRSKMTFQVLASCCGILALAYPSSLGLAMRSMANILLLVGLVFGLASAYSLWAQFVARKPTGNSSAGLVELGGATTIQEKDFEESETVAKLLESSESPSGIVTAQSQDDNSEHLRYQHENLTKILLDYQKYHMNSLLTLMTLSTGIIGLSLTKSVPETLLNISVGFGMALGWFGVIRHINYSHRIRVPIELRLYHLERLLNMKVWSVNVPLIVAMYSDSSVAHPGIKRWLPIFLRFLIVLFMATWALVAVLVLLWPFLGW